MDLKDTFYIHETDWNKLQAWATLAHQEDKNEISGLMTAIPQKDGRFKLNDVEILKQQNSASNTELDKDAVTAYMSKYAMKYNNNNIKFVWWHSHHTMGAFWSGTDENEINAWKNKSFSLALVINLREEYVFRVSVWNVSGLEVEEHFDTTLTIEREVPKISITKDMKKQYKELCSERATVWNGHYVNKGHQTNIWLNQNVVNKDNKEETLVIESQFPFYKQGLVEAERLQDDFMSNVLTIANYKKEIAKFNKTCRNNKLPFSHVKVQNMKQQELYNLLTTTMPDELFEWKDNNLKTAFENMSYNEYLGGGWGWQ